jgi:phospholipid/cholesterol/gamma-HCH transport system substrate-binding protein
MWDFGEDEEDADDPHLRIGADYFVFKGLFLSGGLDNILNDDRRGFYLGGGVRFEDEDFKALLGSLPSVPD